MNRADLPQFFNSLGFKVGAEIGVAAGDFSLKLCQGIPNLQLYCVDPWQSYKGNRRGGNNAKHLNNFELTKKRLEGYDVIYLREKSINALQFVPNNSLDFVFIDGNHDYEYVLEDITEWSKKVRLGGVVSGHDYYHLKQGGVVEAVNQYVAENGIELFLTGVEPQSPDDKQPSFYWFKK